MNGVVCLSSTAKGQSGNLRVANFVSAYFGTTEPDFSELKQGNGLLLEMNIKTSWKITFGGLDFGILRVLCGNNQLLQGESKIGEIGGNRKVSSSSSQFVSKLMVINHCF